MGTLKMKEMCDRLKKDERTRTPLKELQQYEQLKETLLKRSVNWNQREKQLAKAISTFGKNNLKIAHKLYGHSTQHLELSRCANCGIDESEKKTFKKCAGCNLVRYCSKACQRADWKNHKKLCRKHRT